jgi:hypothetical protein
MPSGFTLAEVQAHNARVAAGKHLTMRPELVPAPVPIAKLVKKPTTDEDKLNKTEKRYLQLLRSQGHQWVGVQNITVKLADDCRFTPDFTHLTQEGELVLTDTKGGFTREDSTIKVKVAARSFPFFKFVVAKWIDGVWQINEIKP